MKFWLKQVAVAIDQLINAIFGGWADETLSSRCWRLRFRFPFNVLQPLLDGILSPIGDNHCEESYQSERLKKQYPIELRD